MEKFKFIRRKCEVQRYNRAKKVLEQITFPLLSDELKKEIGFYELKSKFINLFVNHPNLEVVENDGAMGKVIYILHVNLIAKNDDGYFVKPSKITCQLIGENYADRRLNIGADYHSISIVSSHGKIDYWYEKYLPFLVSQLENQDKLEEMCEQLNVMDKNYFSI